MTAAVDENEIERHARKEIISPSASSSSTFSHSVNEEEERRIYLVTDGIKSRQTKKTYLSLFKDFLRTIGSSDLKTLLDYKSSVIESKIISHIEYLKERKLSYSSIQVSCAAILHFFDINDVNLNTRKIKRFLPEDESDRYSTDRPYSVDEIRQILDKDESVNLDRNDSILTQMREENE